ncbi:MAG TPA: NHL repeat-containing protein [Caulobacteraceae bacterium]|jgi:sugar lactone lactonase YvrE
MPTGLSRFSIATLVFGVLFLAGVVFFSSREAKPTAFGWPARMTTVAGNGARGFADGKGATAQFSDPFAVAIDAKGVLYVADAGDTNRIRKIAPDGRTTTLAAAFDTPSGVAVDRDGNLYVADTGANRIRKITPDGGVSTLAGDGQAGFRDGPAGQAQFNGPIGVAVDAKGNVYVADTYNDRIRLITRDGQVKTLAGGAAPGFADGQGTAAAFDTPCGIALSKDGVLFIADMNNNAIRRLDKSGKVTTQARAAPDDANPALAWPVGVAATADGYLYVSTFRRGRIVEVSPKGALRILTGRDAWAPRNRPLQLFHPAGLAVDRHGALYVAETARYAIRKLSPQRPGDAPQAFPEIVPAPPALMRAASVPWPVDPQESWHEVVGDMGEVRGDYRGESRSHIHAGLDVHADVGQTVRVIADEKVEGPFSTWDVDGLSEGLQIDQLTYIHMQVGRTPSGEPLDPAHFQLVRNAAGKLIQVRVKRGTRFHVGDPLGSDNRMAHVHLELGARGGDANPMALHFPGLTDHLPPHIDDIALYDASGRRLSERRNGRLVVPRSAGVLSIVVDAWDQVDGDKPQRRLGLYRAGFQILRADGAPVKGFERPRVTMEFDRLPVDHEAAKIAYAPASGDTVHGADQTRFLYVVTNTIRAGRAATGGWRPAGLAPGDYIVRILAADYAGNQATVGRDLAITVR